MYRPTDHRLLLDIQQRIRKKHGKLNSQASIEFITRLSANFSVLRDHFLSLYSHHENCEKRFRQLILTLYSSYLKRPEELMARDVSREVDHQWLLHQKWVGMSLYPEHFAGSLKHFPKKLKYLQELGINIVHLIRGPELNRNNKDNGYDTGTQDGKAIGKKSEIKSIAKKLTEKEILLMLDFELDNASSNDKDEKEVFGGTRWLIDTIKGMISFANQGVDIIKLDTRALPGTEGSNGINQPPAHTVFKLIKRCTEVVAPGVRLCMEDFASPGEFDITYHSSLMSLIWNSLATTKTDLMYKSLGKLSVKPQGTTWINYLGGHNNMVLKIEDEDIYQVGFDAALHRKFFSDYYTGKFKGSQARGVIAKPDQQNHRTGIRSTVASLAGLEKAIEDKNQEQIELAIKKILLIHALIISYGGLPMLFSGDEIGQTNGYYEDKARSNGDQHINRSAMNWKAAKNRKDTNSVQHKIFFGLKELIDLRKKSLEFSDHNNCQLVYCENQHVLAVLRYPKKEQFGKTLVLMNFQPSVQLINKAILLHQGFDLSRGFIDKLCQMPPKYRKDLIELQPYQYCFISEKPDKTEPLN